MEYITLILEQNSQQDFLIAGGVFLGALVLLKIFKVFILHRLKSLSEKTKNDIDDLLIQFIGSIHWPFLVFTSFYVGSKYLTLQDFVDNVLDHMMIFFAAFYGVIAVNSIIDYVTERLTETSEEDSLIRVLNKIAKGVVWILAILLLISNFGVNITSLIAGLGVGGIAVAFALQKILEDIFSSFSIYFDKPFEVGDFIIIGDDLGTVKHIGIKTTRIAHLKGHELVVSNSELTNTRIHNYKKMDKRRVTFAFGLVYGTGAKKLQKAKQIVTDIIEKEQLTELDRVHFKEFGDFSLNYEVVYYIQSSEYNEYMDTQESINLKMIEEFGKAKIEFAFPTQTILLEK